MLFKKKKEDDEEDLAEEEDENDPEPVSGNISVELTKIRAKLDGFDEVRRTTSERFTRISEQIGELRSMIVDVNKTLGEMEVKTVKAVDLVEAVHPDKLMVDIRKQDGKIEALKANLESNELMMNTIIEELRELRKQIRVFKGLEQVIKLNEEVKSELTDIRKTKAMTERHADKIETIFVEVQKRFHDFSKYEGVTKSLDKDFKRISADFETIKIKVGGAAIKKDVENIAKKVDDFEKHVGNVVTMMQRKAEKMEDQIIHNFSSMDKKYKKRLNHEFAKAKDLHKGLSIVTEQFPDIAQKLDKLQSLKSVKKNKKKNRIKPLGKDEPELKEEIVETKKKKGLFGMFKKKKEKVASE